MKTNTEKKRTGSKRLFLVLLTAFFALLTGVLGVMYAMQREKLSRVVRAYSTIPLRDDQRRQDIHPLPREMHQARFYDDTTLLYVSGKCLYRAALRDGGEELEFRGHGSDIADYEVSPDGGRIVTSSSDGTIRLWDPLAGACLAVSERLDTLDQPSWTMLHDIVYLRGGRALMSADMWGVKIWRARDLKLLSEEYSDYFYMSCGLLSPDGRTLCAPVPESVEGCVVYERKKETGLYRLHDKSPIQYSADGRRLLAVSWDEGGIEIWDIDPRSAARQISLLWFNSPKVRLRAVSLSPKGDLLVSAHEDGTVRVWNALNGAEREILHWEGRKVDGVCFDPKGFRILAYSNESGEYCLWGPFSWMI